MKNKDTLYAVYDLITSPATFDFANFLFLAEHTRIQVAQKKIFVVVVPGLEEHHGFRENSLNAYDSTSEIKHRASDLFWRKHQIMLPLIHLLPSVSGFMNCGSREEAHNFLESKHQHDIFPNNYSVTPPSKSCYTIKNLVKIPEDTEATLKASDNALEYINQWLIKHNFHDKKVISITLRSSLYQTNRNSNIKEWVKFADSLDLDEYVPVFVMDTQSAFDSNISVGSHFTFNEIPWNMELRAAFYEKCSVNMGINNGTGTLALFNQNVKFIFFKMITSGVAPTTKKFFESHDFPEHSQFPFCKKYQKLVWEDDNYEVIKREFELMIETLADESISNERWGPIAPNHRIMNVYNKICVEFGSGVSGAIYGGGIHTEKMLNSLALNALDALEITVIYDRSPTREDIYGIPIKKSIDADLNIHDYILISSKEYEKEIYDELCRVICPEKIIRIYE